MAGNGTVAIGIAAGGADGILSKAQTIVSISGKLPIREEAVNSPVRYASVECNPGLEHQSFHLSFC
jgi:hypothetical protein